jgi:glycosyltransferase involved in cell wall biosynthesis
MRIGIDARFYGTIGKGLGRYTEQLILHLENIDRENEYFIFLGKENFDEYQPRNSRFHKILANIPWYGFKEQLLLPLLLYRYHLDIVHFPHFNIPILYRKPFVMTLHDLILLRYSTHEGSTLPKWLYAFKFGIYKKVLKSAVSRAKHILTVSEFSKNDILRVYPFLPQDRIFVIYEANSFLQKAHISQVKTDEEILAFYGILQPYVLYVGNAYPHKNLSRLIQAFLRLKDDHLSLVLVGKHDVFYRRLIQNFPDVFQRGVVFAGHVPDSDLEILYRNAHVYAFVSLYEGFGLPPLEAMARGIPVVSSQVSSMPEILGDAPLYSDPECIDSIAKILRLSIENEQLRRKCKERGYRQAQKYQWQNLAKETLDVYQLHQPSSKNKHFLWSTLRKKIRRA